MPGPSKTSGSFSLQDEETGDKAQVGTKTTGEKAVHVITEGPGDGTGIDPRPKIRLIDFGKMFLNGSNASMDINGSSTPQEFSTGPTGSEVWYCYGVSVFLCDSGSTDYDEFGAVSTLSNGVQLLADLNSTQYELGNFKRNDELGHFFHRDPIISSIAGEASRGWYDESDLYKGTHLFNQPIELRGADSDEMIFNIRDNITGLTEFTAMALYWRVI